MAPPTPPQGRRSFRFRRKIGSGAFGEVYLAEMVTGGGFAKVVAVKVLKPEFLEEADIVSRMRDEARLLGHLRHPAIVQADDLLILGGRVAIVMEYVPGANLLWLIHPRQNPEPLPPTVLMAIIGRVAEALDAAWSRPSTLTGRPLRVLHRDIKPSNIRITPDGEVKVLDFGVARSDALERETSTHNQLIGSLTFLAPEVFLSHPVLPATDAYALGVTFFESIARSRFGRCGLSPAYHQELLAERLKGLDLQAWGPCTEQVRGLLGGMLAFEPIQRPTSASVARFCAQACRSLPGPELRDWAREHVDRLASAGKQEPDGELVGATLDEESSQGSSLGLTMHASLHPDDVTSVDGGPPRGRRRAWILGALLLVVLLVPALLALGAGVAWYANARQPAAIAPKLVSAPQPPASAAPQPSTSAPSDHPEPVGMTASPPALAQGSVELAGPGDPGTASSPPSAVAPTPAPVARPPAPTPVVSAVKESASAGTMEVAADPEVSQPGAATSLEVELSAPRRALRNAPLHVTVQTGVTGCAVTVFWRAEGQAAWDQAGLAGSGPVYSWSLDVTAEHRPAIQYYVTVGGCGEGGVGSSAEPARIAVL